MNKSKRRKGKEQLNVTFHHEKDFAGLSSNKIMSLTQVPSSPWLTASCTFVRQCDTKPRGLLSDRVSSRKLAILIPLFMSNTEKKSWSDGTLQQCHLHPLVARWTWDISGFVLCLHFAQSEQKTPAYCTTHPSLLALSCDYYVGLTYCVVCCCEWLAFAVLLPSFLIPGGDGYMMQKNPRRTVGAFIGVLLCLNFLFLSICKTIWRCIVPLHTFLSVKGENGTKIKCLSVGPTWSAK